MTVHLRRKHPGTLRVPGTLLMYLKRAPTRPNPSIMRRPSYDDQEGMHRMAPKKTATSASALADAFAALSVEGKPVTVRTLREQAGVSTDAAAEWLRANRPPREVSPAPADVLTRVLDPLWSAAVAVARDEQAEAAAAERNSLVQAEAEALADLAAAVSRAEAAEAAIAQLREDLAAVEADRDALTDRAAAAVKAAEDSRAAAHAAQLSAAEAQATARTLREVLDSLR